MRLGGDGPHRTVLAEHFLNECETDPEQVRQKLDAARGVTRQLRPRQRVSTRRGVWTGLMLAGDDWSAHTAVSVVSHIRA